MVSRRFELKKEVILTGLGFGALIGGGTNGPVGVVLGGIIGGTVGSIAPNIFNKSKNDH